MNYAPEHCPYCGTGLTTTAFDGRERPYCPACERIVWRNPVPCGGVAVVDGDSVLLVERDIDPGNGEWVVPGGHLEVDEDPAVGAARELEEEAGLSVTPADLAVYDTRTYPTDGGKYVTSITFVTTRDAANGRVEPEPETRDARFFTPAEFDAAGETLMANHREKFERAPAVARRRL